MNCGDEVSGWSKENGGYLPPKTNPIRRPPNPPRKNEAISLDVGFRLSLKTSFIGANDLVRSNVKNAPARVRVSEAKKSDRAYGKR